jgi:hypothetical protein
MKTIQQIEEEINSGKLPQKVLEKRIFQLNQLRYNLKENISYIGYLKYYRNYEFFAIIKEEANMYEIRILHGPYLKEPDSIYNYANNNFRIESYNL